MSDSPNWLITGGAGFIGANLVHLAARRSSARLVVLDALTYAGDRRRLEGLDPAKVKFVQGDIADEALVRRLFAEERITHVLHLAAESHVDRSITDPGAFIRTNIQGTFTLLEAARHAWKDAGGDRRFLHVSTDEVYGDLGPDDPPAHEHSPYHPSSPYSAAKAASDHLARAWQRTYRLPVVVTNCSNNYGPWQLPEKLVPLMIERAVSGQALPVYGDGRQIRDWLHVADHCEALLAVLERGRVGETYCIGGECERPNIEVVHLLADTVDAALGRAPGTARALIKHVADRPGHDRRYAIDTRKIGRELGWRPSRPIEAAMAEVVRWYLDHGAWVESVRQKPFAEAAAWAAKPKA